jgi:hypothetical protein
MKRKSDWEGGFERLRCIAFEIFMFENEKFDIINA